jgi:hypothetical protein
VKLRHLSIALLALSGCDLPDRNNPHDSNLRPTARVRVTIGAGGEQVLFGERWQPLTIDVSETSVASGDVTRVVIERLDPRTEGTERCPLREPLTLGELDFRVDAPVLAWTNHTGSCFEDSSGRQVMEARIRATAHTSRGGVDRGTTDFLLVNARPQVDPGPTLWVDPTWGTRVVLDNRRNQDPDPGDIRVDQWVQVNGPPVTFALSSSAHPTFAVDLAGEEADPTSRFGSAFRFQITSCDPWECGEPKLLDVVLRPAVWAATGNGLLLLDGTFTSATRFDDDDVSTAYSTPVELTGTGYSLAPALDGLFVFEEAGVVARHIRGDFTAIAMPTLPAIFQDVVGKSSYGVAWIMAGPGPGPYQILEVGPGETFVPVNTLFPQAMLSRTHISRYAPDSPLWAVGYEAGHFRMTVFTPGGATQDLDIYSGEPLYEDCLGDEEVDEIAADPDGGVWVMGGYGVLRLGPDAEVIDCFPIEDSSFADTRHDAIVVPAADGGTQLLYIAFPSIPFFDTSLRSLRDDGIERLYPDLAPVTIGYDAAGGRLIAATPDGIGSYDIRSNFDDPFAFASMSELFPTTGTSGQNFEITMDAAGRPWLLRRDDLLAPGTPQELLRLPKDLKLVRSVIEEAGAIDSSGQAAVDPRTGNVWVAEKDSTAGWRAVAYDERGAVGPGGVIPLPFVQSVGVAFYDGVRVVRFDPGDVDREPGLWVAYNALAAVSGIEIRVARMALDGTVVASFGGPGEDPAGGFPDVSLALYYGLSCTVDPLDGSLWLSIHDDDLSDARLGETYRLREDGSILRHSTISTQTNTNGLHTIVSPGGMMLGGGNVLHLVRVTEAGMQSQAACFGGDEAGSAGYDAGTAEVILFCWSGGVPSYTTRWDASAGLQIHSLRSPTTPFPVDALQNLNGRQDAVVGTYWSPEEFGVRQYDRYLTEAALYPMPARIRFMIQ